MIDEDYMRMAIDEAHRAEALDEVPIGAVVVYEPIDPATRRPLAEPQVIARACNLRETTQDPRGTPSSSRSSRRPSAWACGA
nr:hypothetical protein [Eggerthella sinensis]